MEQKNWMKQYGIHVVICAAVIGIAFGVNRKIEIDRSHIYAVAADAIVLEKLTEFKTEKGKLVFKGWGFDPQNYSGNIKCELILQDTETGEALWPRMGKNPERQEIEERYADGGDYSAGSFEGRIAERKVDADRAYEVLLRYTAEPENGVEGAGAYQVTVSTNEFLCQGEITEYNPKAFVSPEIAGTALERELEGARLFHYFAEGLWVYVNNGRMYYLLSDGFPLGDYPNSCMGVNWWATSLSRIPEDYQQYQMGNADFSFIDGYSEELSFAGCKVAIREIPSAYASIVSVGCYDRDSGQWIFRIRKQLKEP